MSLKHGLHLSQGQHLSLAPQLQQAIRLLQYSALELTQEIQRLLETNPLLEFDEAKDAEKNEDVGESAVTAVASSEIPPMGIQKVSRSLGEDLSSIENTATASESLQDYLVWQMNMSDLTDVEKAIAHALIDAINDDGYLEISLEECEQSLREQAIETNRPQCENILRQIQNLDPTGVGARTIQECLLLQCETAEANADTVALAKTLLEHHCHFLGRLNALQLSKKCKTTPDTIQTALKFIQTLNPRPGSVIGSAEVDYVIPDVVCERRHGLWTVRLNDAISPSININQQYLSLLRTTHNSRDTQFLRDNLKEARWFLKSLENRNHTLLRVAQCIVERQQGFLEHGEAMMQPMILQDVASQLEVHESTVSRVTTQKYLHTPRGVYELKFFFSSHVKNREGQHCSSTAIRAHIKRYLSEEPKEKPYSDNKIATLLAENHNIKVARRTVTKYREAMNIPSSSERRYISVPLKG